MWEVSNLTSLGRRPTNTLNTVPGVQVQWITNLPGAKPLVSLLTLIQAQSSQRLREP